MDYALLKVVHVLSATMLFGTGLGTAFFMWRALRSGDIRVIAHTSRQVVIADWLFTTPTVVLQPLTGFLLMARLGYPFASWINVSLVLFVVAGLCWLPVVWLQIRMRDIAGDALRQGTPPDRRLARYARTWFVLGIPAFAAMLAVFFLMVFKPY